MKESHIRKIVLITHAKILDPTTHYLELIKAYQGEILSSHKCDEGFVCLVYFPYLEMIYMPSILDEIGCCD